MSIVTGKVIREAWVIAYPEGGQSVVCHWTEASARDTPAVRSGQGMPLKVYVVVPLDETTTSPPWPPKWENCRRKSDGRLCRYEVSISQDVWHVYNVPSPAGYITISTAKLAAEFEPI